MYFPKSPAPCCFAVAAGIAVAVDVDVVVSSSNVIVFVLFSLVFTFTSIFSETSIQRAFFRKIAEDGIDVKIETNGVYYE